ncbi:MAG TPA: ATPase inhibitor subunit zeta [Alphaproteobacteria bacterium]|jgi:hypothetical protein|nr:ATPase inhibitor subunit zeta [Alphaproteobacteria bacterium]
MTTLNDRELALEAHYAAQQLALFREHFAAAKQFGFRVADHLSVDQADRERFALSFAERSVVERADMSEYSAAIEALLEQDAKVAEHSSDRPDFASPTPYTNRPWLEFVAGQMLLLFGSTGAPATETAHTH